MLCIPYCSLMYEERDMFTLPHYCYMDQEASGLFDFKFPSLLFHIPVDGNLITPISLLLYNHLSSVACCMFVINGCNKQNKMYCTNHYSSQPIFESLIYIPLFEWMHRPTSSRVVCMICIAAHQNSLRRLYRIVVCLIDR